MVVLNCEYGENGVFVYVDVGLNLNLIVEEFVDIVILFVKSFEVLVGKILKVVMFLYFIKGLVKFEMVDKVVQVIKIVKEKVLDILIDGEF